MGKGLKVTVGLVGAIAVASYATGLTPNYIMNAPAVATGIGALFTCSARYVSGIGPELNKKNLNTYSSSLEPVEITYDDSAKRVTASLYGIGTTSAQYREGLGCALEIGDTAPLDAAVIPAQTEQPNAYWPLGGKTDTPNASVLSVLEGQIVSDNAAGFETRALLVVKGGRIVAEAYAPGFDRTSKLIGWSMTKSFNALMVGNMEMRGLIDPLKKPVFSAWAADERADISLDDMMHMASGLDLSEIYTPGQAVTAMLFTEHSGAALGIAAEQRNAPGTRFDYSSATTNLMAKLVYDAAGGTLDASLANLHDTFIGPMGLREFVLETDPSGVFLASSFLMASARDWARMGQLMLNKGTLNGTRFVTENWVNRALTPNSTENKKAYGYQFWLNYGDEKRRWPDLPTDTYAALGSREQITMTIPSEGMVIVRLGWALDGSYPANKNFAEIIAAASATDTLVDVKAMATTEETGS
ncbi:MAG: serine hydrolase [Kordiimonadales bacterium]|nr:MAG: serine hydrolase [Kordiimonadales bacterium]